MGYTGDGPPNTSNANFGEPNYITSEMWEMALKTNKELSNRLSKAEKLLSDVLHHNQLSPGQWVSLILDIVEFKSKYDCDCGVCNFCNVKL